MICVLYLQSWFWMCKQMMRVARAPAAVRATEGDRVWMDGWGWRPQIGGQQDGPRQQGGSLWRAYLQMMHVQRRLFCSVGCILPCRLPRTQWHIETRHGAEGDAVRFGNAFAFLRGHVNRRGEASRFGIPSHGNPRRSVGSSGGAPRLMAALFSGDLSSHRLHLQCWLIITGAVVPYPSMDHLPFSPSPLPGFPTPSSCGLWCAGVSSALTESALMAPTSQASHPMG